MMSDAAMTSPDASPAETADAPITATPETISGLKEVPALVKGVFRLALRLQSGELTVILPDGRSLRFQGSTPGKSGVLVIKDYSFANRLITGGGTGMGEAYMDGLWDSPDLATFLEVIAENAGHLRQYFLGRGWARWLGRLAHMFNRNSRAGSKKNIEYHYDLGNAFYRQWLDPTMTYSSAKFDAPDQPLSDAQKNKYRSLINEAEIKPGHSVLEIGCGWGGFAEFAAKEVGCKVTGITISKEQLEFAQKRMFENGLNEKVEIRYVDYRDVQGQFDRVASIEMFEAVGEQYWPSFFGKVRDVLKSGGQAGLQIITIADDYFDDYRRGADFIQRYIFPGGMLPSPTALAEQVRNAGLEWKQNVNFGRDYARTLHIWGERFAEAWPEIEPLGFDERFRRMWNMYLSYCEAGFNAGTIDVTQVALRRP
jgi:cyclopropane-fatty-acyl-phospholipid synthase